MENAALYQQERMQISVDQWITLVVWKVMADPAIQKLLKYIHKVKIQFRTCFLAVVLMENAISTTLIYFLSGHVLIQKNLLLLLLKLLLKPLYKNALNLKAAVFHLLSAFNRVEEFIKSSKSNFQL